MAFVQDYADLEDEHIQFDESLVDAETKKLSDHMHNYTSEVAEFLVSHDTVSVENAIEINRFMQQMLFHLKNKLKDMLRKCRRQYEENEKILMSPNFKLYKFKSITYAHCGAPFFKDGECFPAPNNEDYVYRSKVLKEFFPLDIRETAIATWTVRDKIGLIQGVKCQLIDYLDQKNSLEKRKRLRTQDTTKALEKKIAIHSNRVVDLFSQADENFKINWYRISIEKLHSRHADNCCQAMWEMYLKPEINRGEWTDQDNRKLFRIAQDNRFQDWEKIAKEIGDRSSYQCIVQFQTNLIATLREKNKKWTKEQDMLLKEAVEANRIGEVIRWNKVLSHFPHKTKNQIYTRYKYSLDPNLIKRTFSKEEDCIILAAVQEYGENFKYFPRSLFPGRNRVQIKGRYFNVLKHGQQHQSWTPEDDKKLLQLVDQYGTSNWVAISESLKTHTRTSCRTRYNVIQKYLIKFPNKTVEDLPRKRKKALSDVNMDNWVDKIIEIKNKGEEATSNNNSKKPKKPVNYINRQRSIERDYYEFFKYSYDFKFGEAKCSALGTIKTLLYLKYVLHINIDLEVFESKKKPFTIKERNLIKQLLKRNTSSFILEKSISDHLKLPPSWPTILGLRAVCIQITSENFLEEDEEKSSMPIRLRNNQSDKKMDKVDTCKELFRQRFFSIFYKTAVLSKLCPPIHRKLSGDKYIIEPLPKRKRT